MRPRLLALLFAALPSCACGPDLRTFQPGEDAVGTDGVSDDSPDASLGDDVGNDGDEGDGTPDSDTGAPWGEEESGPADRSPGLEAIGGWHFPVPGWSDRDGAEGRVDDVLRLHQFVYIGGNFLRTEDHADPAAVREPTYLAAQDAATGEDQAAFAPDLDGRVFALAASDDGEVLYAGGDFGTVGGVAQRRLAALDPRTGERLGELPDLDISGGVVRDIAIAGDEMWIVGDFYSVAGVVRTRIAKLVRSDGSWSVDARFEQTADDSVRAIVLDLPDRVFVGGAFSGEVRHHHHHDETEPGWLAALDAATGERLPWDGLPDAEVFDLARDDERLYVASGGLGLNEAYAFGLDDGGLRWLYHADGDLQAVAVDGSRVVWGTHGDWVSDRPDSWDESVPRAKIFLTRAVDGVLEAWAPDLGTAVDALGSPIGGTQGVWALDCSASGDIYVGGDFTRVGAADQQRFAIFAADGEVW